MSRISLNTTRLYFLLLFSFINVSLKAQIITTVAGNGTYGYSGDGGPATSAQMGNPDCVALDNSNNIYITDNNNNVIRIVNSTGIITNFAGTGTLGYSGDGGPATSANLYHPSAIAFDNTGNIYFTDQNGDIIRKISTSGIITTITGNLPYGYSGDGGPLMLAQFSGISNITFDIAGNMYITDFGNNVVRKVNSSEIITTIAGSGTAGFSGDGGPAIAAELDAPYGVLILNNGDILISDARNNRIRVVNSAGIINTYAGTGAIGYSGDGGAAVSATFHWPSYSTIDNLGNIYVTDALNWVVRKIDNTGIITTYAGNGTNGYSGDGGLATLAQMVDVCGIDYDDIGGNLYIVNRDLANVVRKVTTCLSATITQQPENITLCNSGNGTFTVTASNITGYQWQLDTATGWANLTDNSIYSGTNMNTLSITSATTGMNNYQFRCSVTNSCGTSFSSTALLVVNTSATPSISVVASSASICEGTSANFTASAINGGTSPIYQWEKNGINVGTNNPSYTDGGLANGDVINCILTSNQNCLINTIATSNSIVMSVTANVTPTITILPSNNNICFGTPVTFSSAITNGGPTPEYTWFKNSVNLFLNSPAYTDNSLNNGDTIMCVMRSNLSCVTSQEVQSFPIAITIIPLVSPSVTITASADAVCKNTPVVFTASSLNGGNIPIYQWEKNGLPVGNNNNNYTDSNLINGDAITCTLTSSSNCITTSQVSSNAITVSIYPEPVVMLEKNNGLCEGGIRILDAGIFSSYFWNTGSTNRTITINSTGSYSVTVTDNNGCKGTDNTNITTLLALPAGFLPPDTSICFYGNLLLKPSVGFRKYLWSTGSNSSSISITQPGQYWLRVEDNNGCTGADSILVLPKDCLKGFFMPTAFTPNNDGKNDILKPILLGNIKQYQFWIYNRWGQLVFHSTDYAKGWDGSFKELKQDGNVFVWVCLYQFEGETQQTKKGTVVLVR